MLIGSSPVFASENSDVKVELISEVDSIYPSVPFWTAVKITHQNGWHTYWRNPGDAGLPTSIEWTLPEGFSAGKINWPYPFMEQSEGIVSYLYNGEILLLVEITPPSKIIENQISISADVDWLQCKDICVPGSASLKLELPVSHDINRSDSVNEDIFIDAKSKLPVHSTELDFSAVRNQNSIILSFSPDNSHSLKKPGFVFFPYEEGIFDDSAVQNIYVEDDKIIIEIKLDRMMIREPENLEGIIKIFEGALTEMPLSVIEINVPIQKNKKG